MKMNRRSVLALLASTVAVAALTSCATTSSNPQAGLAARQAANAGNFSSVYFLGDSLTAGYQSGSLIDSSQVHGWPVLVAQQLGFPLTLPLIAPPGAPNQLTLVHLSPLQIGQLSGTTSGRDDFSVQPTNVAVPGALVNDVLNTLPLLAPAPGQQQLNQLVLGYPGFGYGSVKSQAQQAVAANPTTIFLWIGSNDALIADLTGSTASMTPIATFTTQYAQLIDYLQLNSSAHLIIANIPDVTAVAYLQPAASVLASTSASTGVPVATLSFILGISPGDFLNQSGLAQIPLILTGQQKGPITDAGVLSAAEAVTVRAQVVAYNGVIASYAQQAGATLVDINALFAQTTANGVTINGLTGNTNFLGGVFSLDGVHPTNTGYAVIANKFIDTMNSAFHTTRADVDLVPIAKADPLFPPYPGHHSHTGTAQETSMPIIPAASLAPLMH